MKETMEVNFTTGDILAYVEYKALHDEVRDDEMEWYEDYKWSGKVKRSGVMRRLIWEMQDEWNGGDVD